VRHALLHALDTVGRIDSITISGQGEPTLHPRFAGVVAEVLAEARRRPGNAPVRILTNGTLAIRPVVRRALDQLDERIVVLDAAGHRVNRPARGRPLGTLVAGLLLLRDVSLQSCFIGGAVSNCDASSVGDWADLVAELRPRRVQIHTINRRSAQAGIHPLVRAQLEEIACVLRARTGIEAEVYA
jgi:wyosine [tRNA(Phe)-imidazoG37] synthetase (radical SAM superfamily)